jgi:hypothetical protein
LATCKTALIRRRDEEHLNQVVASNEDDSMKLERDALRPFDSRVELAPARAGYRG